jgi:hypothetical protein
MVQLLTISGTTALTDWDGRQDGSKICCGAGTEAAKLESWKVWKRESLSAAGQLPTPQSTTKDLGCEFLFQIDRRVSSYLHAAFEFPSIPPCHPAAAEAINTT